MSNYTDAEMANKHAYLVDPYDKKVIAAIEGINVIGLSGVNELKRYKKMTVGVGLKFSDLKKIYLLDEPIEVKQSLYGDPTCVSLGRWGEVQDHYRKAMKKVGPGIGYRKAWLMTA